MIFFKKIQISTNLSSYLKKESIIEGFTNEFKKNTWIIDKFIDRFYNDTVKAQKGNLTSILTMKRPL